MNALTGITNQGVNYAEFLASSHTALDGHIELDLLVPGVGCTACCLKIEDRLRSLPGIEQVNVSLADKRLTVVSSATPDLSPVIEALVALGYPPRVASASPDGFKKDRRSLLARLGVAGIAMMQVMMFALTSYLAGEGGIEPAYKALMNWASFAIAIPVTFYCAMPFHRAALRHLVNRSLGMDLPVSIAILSAFFLSAINTLQGAGEVYFDSVCMFSFFLLTGRFLELTARHAWQLDQSLAEHLLPRMVTLPDGRQVPLTDLKAGDELTVEAGKVIPADGTIVQGACVADESAFTGEAVPLHKVVGDSVLAGSTNLGGRITLRVAAPFDDWTVSVLSRLFRHAISFKPRFAVLADQIARYFIGTILLLAVGTALYWYVAGSSQWFVIALAVLVVSCPCALSLATPIAYSVASGAIRKKGVLVGNGAFLENLARASVVVFDKTGTLTEGKLDLVRIQLVDCSLGIKEAVNIAASLEKDSHHPIARTFADKAELRYEVSESSLVPGCGVAGVINGAMFSLGRAEWLGKDLSAPDEESNWVGLTKNSLLVCWFAFQDLPRPNARIVCDRLRDMGKRTMIFSGDKSRMGRKLAGSFGTDSLQMGMTPEDKLAAIRSLQASGEVVLMVGDGVNDAGALAAADLSLAVNPVDIIVSSAADASLVGSNLESVPLVIDYSGRVTRVIRQNLGWAFVYNLLVIPAAMGGFIAPWVAALGMSMSSLLVILNACRLARI